MEMTSHCTCSKLRQLSRKITGIYDRHLLTDQVTVWGKLPVPETLAVNCCGAPGCTLLLEGLTDTEVMVGAGAPGLPDPPPQAVQSKICRTVTVVSERSPRRPVNLSTGYLTSAQRCSLIGSNRSVTRSMAVGLTAGTATHR